jgi:hypothetical protein
MTSLISRPALPPKPPRADKNAEMTYVTGIVESTNHGGHTSTRANGHGERLGYTYQLLISRMDDFCPFSYNDGKRLEGRTANTSDEARCATARSAVQGVIRLYCQRPVIRGKCTMWGRTRGRRHLRCMMDALVL